MLLKRKHKSTVFFSFDRQKMCFYDVSKLKIYSHTITFLKTHKNATNSAQIA